MSTQRAVAGFYHDSPVWIEKTPVAYMAGGTVDFDAFRDEIYRTKLDTGIELKVTREGLFAFDFTDWGVSHPVVDVTVQGFEPAVDAVLQRTLVMNSFLVLMYSVLLRDERACVERMVVTPELVISMDGLGDRSSMGFSNSRVSHLALSSYPSTYQSELPFIMDDRISKRYPIVPTAVLRTAAKEFDALLASEGQPGLALADLYLRANRSYQEHNYSLSLIMAWAVVEKLINRLWSNYQADNSTREDKPFIDASRKRRLNDGRTFTASVIVEVLSIAGVLDMQTYSKLQKARKARNDWMHNLKVVEASAAQEAMEVCSRLLLQVMSLDLRPDFARRIHG